MRKNNKVLIVAIMLLTLLITGCGLKDGKKINYFKNPNAEEVAKVIETINGVSEVCVANEDNDINGQLGKPSGPTGLVYFVYDKAPKMTTTYDDDTLEERAYKDTCEKGTEAGGSIEIYANSDDAKKRNEYLGAFDGGALSSGSHKVEGTLVIRTSDSLKSSEQKELEQLMIDSLTNANK